MLQLILSIDQRGHAVKVFDNRNQVNIKEVTVMSNLENVAAFADTSAISPCGSACGAADPKTEEKAASACGSACGAADPKPEEKPTSACGSACGAGDPKSK